MKILVTFFLSFVLVGCAGGSIVTAKQFDPIEFNNIVRLHTQVQYLQSQCPYPSMITASSPHTIALYQEAHLYTKYSNNRPLAAAMETYSGELEQFIRRYNSDKAPSEAYCKIKTDGLLKMSEKLMEVSGRARK